MIGTPEISILTENRSSIFKDVDMVRIVVINKAIEANEEEVAIEATGA